MHCSWYMHYCANYVNTVWARVAECLVSKVASQQEVPGIKSTSWLVAFWCGHVLHVSAWVSTWCSVFSPQAKDMQVKCNFSKTDN